MRHLLLPLLTSVLAAIAFTTSSAKATEATSDTGNPIVLELFTSQGCSSCPPADELLGRLAERKDVIALSLHVDYWNYLGWSDPFSSAAFTQRQQSYVRQLKARSAYTPMLVVDGESHCVGSQVQEVEALLRQAQSRKRLGHLQVTPKLEGNKLAIDLEVTLGEATDKKLDLLVAITERKIETPVRSGENANHKLANYHVTRRLEKVGKVAKGAGTSSYHLDVELGKGWQKENLEVVAFLQESGSLAIQGAASSPVVPAQQ